jgi:hypothetical protein
LGVLQDFSVSNGYVLVHCPYITDPDMIRRPLVLLALSPTPLPIVRIASPFVSYTIIATSRKTIRSRACPAARSRSTRFSSQIRLDVNYSGDAIGPKLFSVRIINQETSGKPWRVERRHSSIPLYRCCSSSSN